MTGLPDTMSVAVYRRPGVVEVEQRPVPRPGAGEVLGSDRTDALLHLIDRLDAAPDAAVLPAAARSHPPQSAAHRQTRSVSP